MADFTLIAAGDWIGAVVTVVMLLIYIINSMFDKTKQNQPGSAADKLRRLLEQQQAEQRERERRGEYEQGTYDEYEESYEDEEQSEVEAFLQEVAALRQQTRDGSRPAPVVAEVVEPEVEERRQLSDYQSGVGTHVHEYMDSRAERFQSQVAADTAAESRVDSKIDDAITAKFEHALGSLGTQDSTDATYDPQKVAASNAVLAIFQDPARFRRTFVAQELLERPTWSEQE